MIISFVYAYKSDVSTQNNLNTEIECHTQTRYSKFFELELGTQYSKELMLASLTFLKKVIREKLYFRKKKLKTKM